MTDNRTTELRANLTERGVEYATDDSAASKVTMWTTQNGGWMFDCDYMEPLNEKPGTIGAKTELMIYGYTPEQAIAATLGRPKVKKVRGLTYDEHGGEVYYLACSGCGDWVDGDLDCIGENDGPNFCHNCGGEFDGPLLCKRCGKLADMEFGDMCAECYWGEGEGNDER